MFNLYLAFLLITSGAALRLIKKEVSTSRGEGGVPSLFCFTIWAEKEHPDLVPEVKKQFSKCDDYIVFAQKGQTPLFKEMVSIPQTCSHKHCNMKNIMPAWQYLIENGIVQKYDYILQTELDHFVRPSKVIQAIDAHLNHLNMTDKSPLMIQFGNANIFNKKMVNQMQQHWSALSNTFWNGCPDWRANNVQYGQDGFCKQDMLYGPMATLVIKPSVQVAGASGCGKFSKDGGTAFPLACWNMEQNPFGHSEDAQLKAIRQIAKNADVISYSEAEISHANNLPTSQFVRSDSAWTIFTPGKSIPIIHHVTFPSVMRLANELLGY